MATDALQGFRIVDLAWVVAGPLVGRALADFGATVVRIESATRLDTARVMGPFPDAKPDSEKSLLFENCNANKLGLTLDLRTPEARAVVRDLVAWGDALIESFMPGQMERFELDYPRLKVINPRLVMLSSSLMGQTGPNARFSGFGNVGGALAGFQQIVGQRDGLPIGPYGPYTDYVGPKFGLVALLAALHRQRRTGEGCHLDLAQAEAAIALLAPELLDQQVNGVVAAAQGNRDPRYAPCGLFPTAGEDRWVAIVARSDAQWQTLAQQMGGDVLAADPRFRDLPARHANEDALEALIADWTATREAEALEIALQALGVPAHVVARSSDVLADPQVAAREQLVRMPHPLLGETIFDAARYQLSETPARYRRTAPTLGRDNQRVLSEILGYAPERIAALEAAGAIA